MSSPQKDREKELLKAIDKRSKMLCLVDELLDDIASDELCLEDAFDKLVDVRRYIKEKL